MIMFWLICALLLIVALMFVLLPLLRGNKKSRAVRREDENLEIVRDQIAEMDADLKNGLLTQDMYDQGKGELQSRLLDEVGEEAKQPAEARASFKLLAIVLAVLLPTAAVGVYWKVGNQHALLQQDRNISSEGFNTVQSEFSLKALEDKVAENPNDIDNLATLARSYAELERFPEAAAVYEKLSKMLPNEAGLWADYADVMAMAAGRTLVGKPTQMLNKALSIDPDNFKALALSGSAAMERGDYKATIAHWERLLKMIPNDDQNGKIVEEGIQKARVLLAQKSGAKIPAQSQRESGSMQAGKEAISGTVVLSDSLKAHVSPDDTVFVLVRAAQGPKMPLAIVRKQVRDLPFKFTLDDSTSMSPQMKVSNFDQVVVVARVSKSGNAMTQAGDLMGMSAVIKPGTKGLKLSIDQVAP